MRCIILRRCIGIIPNRVQPHTPEYRPLSLVQPAILSTLQKLCPDDWKIISCCLQGPRDDGSKPYRIPTVLITINPGEKSHWTYTEELLLDALQAVVTEVDSAIESTPSLFQICADDRPPISHPLIELSDSLSSNFFPLIKLPNPAPSGSSIGARNTTIAGTLGIWGKFQPPNSTTKVDCFLTSYNVVSKGDMANIAVNNSQGIGLFGRSILNPIIIDYPTASDTKDTKVLPNKWIESESDSSEEFTEILELIEEYKGKRGTGPVLNACGNRMIDGQRMDWAIVGMNEVVFLGSSMVPSATFNHYQKYFGRILYHVSPYE